MDEFSASHILAGLDTGYVGRNPLFFARVGSTNSEARRLADAGAPEGTLVIADYQTAGRGRLDRRWEAPPGSSLLLSLLFRPSLEPAHCQWLTMVCALAVLDAVEQETGLRPGLKWPNDIVLGSRAQPGLAKLGGVLAETGIRGAVLEYVVVGLGLNVNLDPTQLVEPLMPAASLSSALGRPVERLPLLRAFLRATERRYEALKAGSRPHDEYAGRLLTLGQRVVISGPDGKLEGQAEAMDADGALLLRLSSGQVRAVVAGDVTLRS